MIAVMAVLPGSDPGGPIGPIVLIFVLLFVIVGLVVTVRFVLKRVRDSVLPEGTEQIEEENERSVEMPIRPPSVRELKVRFLRGEIAKADYDDQVRAIQLDDHLKGKS